ncbi:hypothetical protein QO002_006181 [Pararhizobium capsulatum DSM 1112]|uniref:Uncharacterized protein n=1 Tax=Pararhizobium capsulatum DSM 1112 TaxID=1121113 RepID=A0ABU0C0E2_9HYPH|nr:hypothetical protein [Pararhizobium capsulatum]MDQ0323974.1 hypothetical protein [Pararhizobium capsulatum DSM 1112]
MPTIQPPAYPGKYEDRFLDCQREIDTRIIDLVSEACRAGWSAQEVLAAVIEVADNLMLGADENDQVNALLSALKNRTAE